MIRTRIGMDRLRAAWAARQERLPRDHGHPAMMDASMTYLRQFAPAVLAAVQFAVGPGTEQLLQGVSMLTGLNATGARKVPGGAPVGFVATKWPATSPPWRGRRRDGVPALLGAVRAGRAARRAALR